jgi:hypothetical protein
MKASPIFFIVSECSRTDAFKPGTMSSEGQSWLPFNWSVVGVSGSG